MNNRAPEVTTVIGYHERTEHRLPDRFAASLGYLDWKTQPDPFRRYEGAERIELPLCEPSPDLITDFVQLGLRRLVYLNP